MRRQRRVQCLRGIRLFAEKYGFAVALTGTTDEGQWDLAFPAGIIDSSSPPVVTIHGTWDTLVPFSGAVALHARLDQAGVKNFLTAATSYEHGCESFYYGGPQQMLRWALERFLASEGL